MAEKIILKSRIAREAAIRAISQAPEGYEVTIKERTRTADQNARLHAMLSDISRQAKWGGKRRTIDDWKALMVSAHRVALNQSGELVPGIEGEFVQLRKSTTAMTVQELASLLEYVEAWGVNYGIKFSAPRWIE